MVKINTTFASVENNTYDEVPYESYPYSQSSPYHLMTLAKLFGLDAQDPKNARVLELGCASGGNLIPHAVSNPDANFVGVDLSRTQIQEANKVVEALGLKNIEFHHMSITDVSDQFGKFDYIIAHGVISWVPDFVRAKIFDISKQLLNPTGVAYISYNTLPGWNMVRTIRDMMLYHSTMFYDVKQKISQSRSLLNFIKDSLEGSNTPYAQILKQEADILSKQSDHYLRHDHLEEENKQYYFHEFIKEAQNRGLQYLSDCSLSTMYLGNMPKKAAEVLKDVNDIVKTEQYMDFITNRRFRSTLLCHNTASLNRVINNTDIKKFNISFNISAAKEMKDVNLNDAIESLDFFLSGNKDSKVSTSSPNMKAILYTFAEKPHENFSYDEIISKSNEKLGGGKEQELEAEFLNNAINLLFQGYLTINILKTNNASIAKPKVNHLVKYQTSKPNQFWATNALHGTVGLTIFEKYVARYMDGLSTAEDIAAKIIDNHVSSGELALGEDLKQKNPDEIKADFVNAVKNAISKFQSSLLLSE